VEWFFPQWYDDVRDLICADSYTSEKPMVKFLLWCILFVLCWPLALLALVLYPIIWLLLLPFRMVGIAVGGVLALFTSVIMLPARVLRRS
jgi:hypothetical protein